MQGCLEGPAMRGTAMSHTILLAALAGDTMLTVVGWAHALSATLGLHPSLLAYQ